MVVTARISGMILSSSAAVKAGGQRDCSPSICSNPDKLNIECENCITYIWCIFEIGTGVGAQ